MRRAACGWSCPAVSPRRCHLPGCGSPGSAGASAGRACPGPGTRITDLALDEPMVTDYLWDEVLGRQSAQTRMFLLRTSITEDVSGDLADALTGQSGGAGTLDRLTRENSFVDVLDRERGCYRYHPLLREVLIAGLHREIPHETPALLD